MPPTARGALQRLSTLTPAQITHHLDTYPDAVAYKSSLQRESTLVELDEWYQSLPSLSSISDLQGSISGKDDLVRLMRWKLAREKHRPTLLSLISSNPAELCETTLQRAATHLLSHTLTSDAHHLLTAVESTMRILAQLRGVGPATSSAIVASWCDAGIFQSDELVLTLFGANTKIDYSWSFYKRFYTAAIECAKENALQGRQLEKVAWSMFYNTAVADAGEKSQAKPDRGQGSKASKRKQASRTTTKDEAQEQTPRRTSKRIRTQP